MNDRRAEQLLKRYIESRSPVWNDPWLEFQSPPRRVRRTYLKDVLLYAPGELDGAQVLLDFILHYIPRVLLEFALENESEYTADHTGLRTRYTVDALSGVLEMLQLFSQPPKWRLEEYLPALVYCDPPRTGPLGRLIRSLGLLFHANLQRYRREDMMGLTERIIAVLEEYPVSAPFTLEVQLFDLRIIVRHLHSFGLIRRPHGVEVER